MTKNKEPNKNYCSHCESEIGSNFIADNEGRLFCCEGCLSVYNLINNEGFSSFYNKRVNWEAVPVEKIEASPEYFEGSIKTTSQGYTELNILISGVRCAACIWLIENSLSKEDGLVSIRMNYANHKAKIIFDSDKISLGDVLKKITNLGYCPLPYSTEESASDKERKDYFYRFGTAAFFNMQLMIYSVALYAGYFQGMDEGLQFFFKFISWFLATPVLLYSGLPFFKNSIKALKNKHFTMDTLVAMGSGSAYLYSIAALFLGKETYFDTSATIITLILLGRFIEAGVKQKSGDAVKKLLSLQPTKVKLYNSDDDIITIPISQLKVGDLFEVSSGGAIAADGIVEKGDCDVDESMLTGEPIPVHKEKKSEVFTGTKCLTGKVIVRATSIGNETFLSKIAMSVEEAQETKAPIQDVADKFIGKFVPFVLMIAIITFVSWFLLGDNISSSLMKAVSVLVIACPCAMGLATPLAIITASSRLSETGIVFKNGEAIERFAGVNDFYFDKTGTITKGIMTVNDYYINESNINAKQLILSSVRLSSHPASKAIAALSDIEFLTTSDFKDIPAKGNEAVIDNNNIISGSLKFMEEKGVILDNYIVEKGKKWQENGYTIVYSSINNKLLAVFALSDVVREQAVETINLLQKNGYNVTLVTGDSNYAAKKLIDSANLNISVYAGVSPFDKAEIIKQSKNPSKTVMVGDGINDAIALSAAGIGISMREGTDISIESADAVMLRSNLDLIVKAHTICKKGFRIIKENLFWAFSYNLIAIPLAVTGLIHPVMSAGFMSFSSLFVVLNSLRIKKF